MVLKKSSAGQTWMRQTIASRATAVSR